jgi:hypothetical protein
VQFVESTSKEEVAATSAAQTMGSAHQQTVIAEMHKGIAELHNLNYNAVKAQAIAQTLEKEHMESSQARRRERQQPGATLSALSDTDATKAHVAVLGIKLLKVSHYTADCWMACQDQ